MGRCQNRVRDLKVLSMKGSNTGLPLKLLNPVTNQKLPIYWTLSVLACAEKDEAIIVDIRLFNHVNEGIIPTIKGINLSLKQWNRLVKRMRIIQSDVRTVQKRLHTPTNVASLL